MAASVPLEVAMVIIAGFLLACVVASKVSAKLGVPALLLFLGIGMLAGSDGPGGIHFEDMALAKSVGTVALAFILFAGGMDTQWRQLRPVFWKGVSLSTIGVAVTCALVGAFAHFVLGLPPMVALLLGAVVSSTDAAAVFGVLRSSGMRLKHRIRPLLEIESGANDPVAVFLTLGLTELCMHPGLSPIAFVPHLLVEMPVGLAIGLLAGNGAVVAINRLRLDQDGLYPMVTIATVCFSFGAAQLIGGNPFLSVYVAGVVMGSRNFLHRLALIQFHDALAWLTQIVMFVALGLLVFPSDLLKVWAPGTLLSLFLILVARPLAVFIALLFSRMPVRSKLFVSWAGLRGAVPIILATFPAIAGLPEAHMIFNLVFFVVVISVLIQGTTLKFFASRLSVLKATSVDRSNLARASTEDLLEVTIEEGSKAIGRQIVDLGLPATALIVLLRRNGGAYMPRGSTVLQPGDELLLASRRRDGDELKRRFK